MKIYLGSDHRGFHMKELVFAYLAKHGYDVQDIGGKTLDQNDDFPEFAQAAALQVIGSVDRDPRAILLCGGGQGMAMAANRFRGIRASVIWDAYEAKMTTTAMSCVCLRAFSKITTRRGRGYLKHGSAPHSQPLFATSAATRS